MAKQNIISEKTAKDFASLRKKSFGISDFGKVDETAVRQLHYWLAGGFVNAKEGSGWQKFDFYTFLWILMIQEFKQLNISNDILQKCSLELFKRKNEPLNILEFENAVLTSLVHRKDVLFVMNILGDFVFVYTPSDIPKTIKQKGYYTCLIVDIIMVLKKFLSVKEFSDYIMEMKLLSKEEALILNFLQQKNKAVVTISYLKNNVVIMGDDDQSVEKFLNAIFLNNKYKNIGIAL